MEGARRAIQSGVRAFVIVAPTGAGKTIIAALFAQGIKAKGKDGLIVTHRKILLGQASDTLNDHGIIHGLLASGHDKATLRNIQIASIQTLNSWVVERGKMEYPPADVLLVDEAHSNTGPMALAIIDHYKKAGAIVIGLTATPVGLAGIYDAIVDGGKYSELRADGRLVPCEVYAPSEPDMNGVKVSKGEFVSSQAAKRVEQCGIVGDIYHYWRKLNPFALPTVVFAPSVAQSRWIVENVFRANGFTAEHIDGETEEAERDDIFGRYADGRVKVLSSCGVLREGWNAPCAAHGILLQPCAGLSSYIQIAGRILRAYPGKEVATLQDHVGAFWRHNGPPDQDWEWNIDDSDSAIAKRIKKAKEQGKAKEPLCCPKCSFVRQAGPACPQCGFEHDKSVRHVRTQDGRLQKMTGPVVKAKRQKQATDHLREAIWQAVNSEKTVGQMVGMFNAKAREAGRPLLHESEIVGIHVPSRESVDWHRRAADVFTWARRKATA